MFFIIACLKILTITQVPGRELIGVKDLPRARWCVCVGGQLSRDESYMTPGLRVPSHSPK